MAPPRQYQLDMVAEFGDWPTPPATKVLDLPDHPKFMFGLLTDDDLYDATDGQYDFEITKMDSASREFLKQTYTRITHQELDLNVEFEDEMLKGWQHCHNGLWKVREQEWLDDEHIHHLAERLITWCQDQDRARLGNRNSEDWWIIPDAYHLRLAGDEESPPLGHFLDEDVEEYIELHDKFDKAKFTVHMVHHVNHWAVLIYQTSNGNTFYLDSMPAGRRDRSDLALEGFQEWLEASDKDIHTGAEHVLVRVPSQEDAWSCGLHAVVNAMAFLRYESLGWDKIEGWTKTKSRPMRRELIACLHRLMGLDYIPGESPTAPRVRDYRQPRPKRAAAKQSAAKQSANKKAATTGSVPKGSPKKPSPKTPTKESPAETATKGSPRKTAPPDSATRATRQAKSTSPPPFGVRGVPLGRELVNATHAEAQAAALVTANRLAAYLQRQQQESEAKAARQALRRQELAKRAARQAIRARQRDAWAADAAKVGKKPVGGRRGAISQEPVPTAADLQHQEDATSGTSRRKRKIGSAPGLIDNTPVSTKRSRTSRKSGPTTANTTTSPTAATAPPPTKPKSPSTTKPPSSPPSSKRRSARSNPATTTTATTPSARATKPRSAPTPTTAVGSRDRASAGSKRKALEDEHGGMGSRKRRRSGEGGGEGGGEGDGGEGGEGGKSGRAGSGGRGGDGGRSGGSGSGSGRRKAGSF
ncbi:hypothetical protein F5144DRAFT_484532 [Chaetomium tenue]|uniref:Uncharacterized protein n=1 Tax=Chaetomium tenue TaxID=1854479 RepID=A0ACB7PHZ5_9PEZI|nr:hypothetical protein F5144DRAFT_484532 [Chaetomium globosum]